MKEPILSVIKPTNRAKTLDRIFRAAMRHLAEDYLTEVHKHLEDHKNKLLQMVRGPSS